MATPAVRWFDTVERREAPAPDTAQTLSRLTDVVSFLLVMLGCPAEHRAFVDALLGAADGRTEWFDLADLMLGIRARGDGAQGIKRASLERWTRRAREAFFEWQTGAGLALVECMTGGRETRTGALHKTRYRLPLLAVAADVFERAQSHPEWGSNPAKAIRRTARPLLKTLGATGPAKRERDGIGRPGGPRSSSEFKRALGALAKGIDLAEAEGEDWRPLAAPILALLAERGLLDTFVRYPEGDTGAVGHACPLPHEKSSGHEPEPLDLSDWAEVEEPEEPTQREEAPRTLVDPAAVPPEMRDARRWLVWRYELRDGKRTKPPYRADAPELRADPTNPDHWTTFDQAVRAYRKDPTLSGLGFALGDGWAAVDLDHCIHNGRLSDRALDAIETVNSYPEVSPGKDGVRIVCRGELPPGRRKGAGFELYDGARYVTVTGNHAPLEGAASFVEERTAELAKLHAKWFPDLPPGARSGRPAPQDTLSLSVYAVSDEVLFERIRRSPKDGARFDRLMRGDTSDYGDDHSDADMALVGLLVFWTAGDPERIDAVFRGSGLMRPKWDRPLRRDDPQTYGAHTIATAIDNHRGGFYSGRRDA